jgi:hypothetical protein
MDSTFRSVFVNAQSQDDQAVQATPFASVCQEVWRNFKFYYAQYDAYDQALFEVTFANLRSQVTTLSPEVAAYGGGGQCPKGPELAGLLGTTTKSRTRKKR